jgi:hypothetical protein
LWCRVVLLMSPLLRICIDADDMCYLLRGGAAGCGCSCGSVVMSRGVTFACLYSSAASVVRYSWLVVCFILGRCLFLACLWCCFFPEVCSWCLGDGSHDSK